MKARDVMVSPVITVKPNASVPEVARTLLDSRISAVPVVDDKGKLVGIVSEGDLIHRQEAGTEKKRLSWWLQLFVDSETLAADYIKAHARKVSDVMTRKVITAHPDTPVDELATVLEKNAIKRVPIVSDGQLVGIVTRANLIQALAATKRGLEISLDDAQIRDRLLAHLKAQPWTHTGLLNVTVSDGIVDLWGLAESDAERRAIRIAAEGIAGARAVNDNLTIRPIAAGI